MWPTQSSIPVESQNITKLHLNLIMFVFHIFEVVSFNLLNLSKFKEIRGLLPLSGPRRIYHFRFVRWKIIAMERFVCDSDDVCPFCDWYGGTWGSPQLQMHQWLRICQVQWAMANTNLHRCWSVWSMMHSCYQWNPDSDRNRCCWSLCSIWSIESWLLDQ